MREVMRWFRWRRSGRGALAALVALTLASCAAPAQSPVTTPSASGQGLFAEVGSFQLLAGQPGRLLVALTAADNRWVSFGSLGMSFSYLGDGTGSPPPDVVEGDATAHFLAIPGSPDGDGQPPTLTFPADARGLYAAEPITFPTAGYWNVLVRGELGDGSPVNAEAAFTVLDTPAVIAVGALAPHTDNPVIGDPGVPLVAIDSRAQGSEPIPDPELHTTSIADAIEAGHPALVVFSTPVYCVSRMCGPVTDLVAELAAQYGDRADFIHVEIYRDFQARQVNQAALDWLQTPSGDLREPWTFLIGADGRIAASWDTLVTRGEVEPLLKALPPK